MRCMTFLPLKFEKFSFFKIEFQDRLHLVVSRPLLTNLHDRALCTCTYMRNDWQIQRSSHACLG